jgi:predicted RNase H-like nuclease (RuvC/YqgF family)
MLKEDLNARLIQRAELVGHREEMDEIYSSLKVNNKAYIDMYFEEMVLIDEIKKITETIGKIEQKNKILVPQIDVKNSAIKELNNRLNYLQNTLNNLMTNRNRQVEQDTLKIEQLENEINQKN